MFGGADSARIALVNQAFVPPGMEIGQTGAHLPGLGLLMLASTIRETRPELADRIRYFDEEDLGEEGCVASVRQWVSGGNPGIVMLTTYTLTHHRQLSFAEEVRGPGIVVIAGGPHVTAHPETSNADIVVRGEGVSAMRALFFDDHASEVPASAGICFSKTLEDGSRVWELSPPSRKLRPEQWPNPSFAYDIIPKSVRHRASSKRDMDGLEPMTIILSKGCPEACHFCSSGAQNGKWRTRSISRFRDDLAFLLAHHDLEALEFHDDDFLAHPEIDSLLDVVGGLGIPWNCYGRVDHFAENGLLLAEKLRKHGCRRMFLGLESMDDSKLELFNKRANSWMNRNAVMCCAAQGLEVAAGWIIGAPGDTKEGLYSEFEKFLELPLYSLDVNILSLNPGAVLSKKLASGNMSLPVGQYGDSAATVPRGEIELLPDSDKFGALEPWGQPTVCDELAKSELNELASIFRGVIGDRFPSFTATKTLRAPGRVHN